jgi:hypothetical protein
MTAEELPLGRHASTIPLNPENAIDKHILRILIVDLKGAKVGSRA